MKERAVSIIIPTFEIDKTRAAINHIFKQSYKNMEIIVVNDNPRAKVSSSMKQFMKKNKIRLINNPKNLGIAESLNVGIRAAKSPVISILCRDYFPESKDWVKDFMDKLYGDSKVGCVVSPIVWTVNAWKRYTFPIRLFTFRHISKPQYGGGNYKKEVFEKVGLFNTEKYAFAGEDCDMHARTKKAGYKIERVEDRVIHIHYDGNSKIRNVLKKEYRYGEAHGALKRDWGILRRVGLFDFEIRLLFFLSFIITLFISPLWSLIFLLPFFLVSTIQSIRSFIWTKWLPGLILYPFVGIIILAVQTAGAVNGFFKGKQNK